MKLLIIYYLIQIFNLVLYSHHVSIKIFKKRKFNDFLDTLSKSSKKENNINKFFDITNIKGPISNKIVSFLYDNDINKLSNIIDNLIINNSNLLNNNIHELYNSIKPKRYKQNIKKYIKNKEIIISFDNESNKIYLWSNKTGDCLISINIPTIQESFDITSLEISSNYKYIICYFNIGSTEKKKIIIISIETFKYLKLNNINNTIISNCGLRSFNITNGNLSIMDLKGTKVYAELPCNNEYKNIITSEDLIIYISNSSIDFINLEKFINNIKFDHENFKYCKFSNDKKNYNVFSKIILLKLLLMDCGKNTRNCLYSRFWFLY